VPSCRRRHAAAAASGVRSAAAPGIVNGAAVPGPAKGTGATEWCAGAYSESAGDKLRLRGLTTHKRDGRAPVLPSPDVLPRQGWVTTIGSRWARQGRAEQPTAALRGE
jgi:hypothetical protein